MHLGELENITILFEHPKTHLFPYLTTLILEQSNGLYTFLTKLGASFDASRPLKLLCLAERALLVVLEMLQRAPELHVGVLRLSSRHFRGSLTSKWEWREFEDGEWEAQDWEAQDWEVQEWQIEYAQKLLDETRKRGIMMEAADKPMEEILKEAKIPNIV